MNEKPRHYFRVETDSEFRKRLRIAAASENLTVSDWLRKLVEEKLKPKAEAE